MKFIVLLLTTLFLVGAQKATVQSFKSEINVLDNPGFEYGLSKWTASAGSFTKETSDVWLGSTSGKWDAGASGQYLDSQAVDVPKALYNKLCVIEFHYNGGDANLKVGAWDGSAYLGSTETTTLSAATSWVPVWHTFTCPSSGTVQVRIESTADAAEIKLDGFYLGYKTIATIVDPRWPSYDESEVTVTSDAAATFVVVGADFKPHQSSSGKWWLLFNIDTTHGNDTSFAITIEGVLFDGTKAVTVGNQEGRATTSDGTDDINVNYDSTKGTTRLSGDIPLASKPTWATKSAPDLFLANMPENDVWGDWTEYTPVTQGFGTISGVNVEWRRVGDSMELRGYFTAGTVAASEARIGLPGSHSLVVLGSETTIVGKFAHDLVAASGYGGLVLATNGDTYVNFGESANSASNHLAVINGNDISTTGDRISFLASVKILGWTTAEYLANAITGFNTAADGRAGLVTYKYEELDISSSGDFDAGQSAAPLRITKVGSAVTLSWHGLDHSSDAEPATAAGFIPSEYRPPSGANARTIYRTDGTWVKQVIVSSGGTISFDYRDWAGSLTVDTTTTAGSLSWNVDE